MFQTVHSSTANMNVVMEKMKLNSRLGGRVISKTFCSAELLIHKHNLIFARFDLVNRWKI